MTDRDPVVRVIYHSIHEADPGVIGFRDGEDGHLEWFEFYNGHSKVWLLSTPSGNDAVIPGDILDLDEVMATAMHWVRLWGPDERELK